jgi:hypothetical protein
VEDCYFMDTVSAWADEDVEIVVMVHTTLLMSSMALNCIFKMVKMVNFNICIHC